MGVEAFFETRSKLTSRLRAALGAAAVFQCAGAADSEDERGEIGELHDPETHLIPLALAATAKRT